MRKIEKYMILHNFCASDLSKEVLMWIEDYGYEVLGATFWNGKEYCQTIVKYSD